MCVGGGGWVQRYITYNMHVFVEGGMGFILICLQIIHDLFCIIGCNFCELFNSG